MPNNNELINALRAAIQEEMQTVRQEVRTIVQEELIPVHQELHQMNTRLDKLEKGQRKLQRDVSTIKKEVRAVWDDILRLDNRLSIQEKKNSAIILVLGNMPVFLLTQKTCLSHKPDNSLSLLRKFRSALLRCQRGYHFVYPLVITVYLNVVLSHVKTMG